MDKSKGIAGLIRNYKRRVYKKLNILQLQAIFICPSHDCNANCVHCYEKFSDKPRTSLSTEVLKDIIRQFKKLGGERIYFCSGEFLLRNDALELIRYGAGFKMDVSVTTNGILIDERKITELKEAGLTALIVSIDSANEERHDELRGVKGCFKKAVNALHLARKHGIATEIWSYVTKTNYDELDGVAKLGRIVRSRVAFVFFPLLSGNLFDRPDENLSYEERQMFRKRFNTLYPLMLEFPDESTMCRGGGKEHICVMPSGEVTFCPPVPYSYGSVYNEPLLQILKRVVIDHNKFSMKNCTGQCIVNFKEYRENCNAKFIYERA